MSLFVREQRSLSGAIAGNLSDLVALRGEGRSTSLSVTPDTAMRHSVVNQCVQTLCNLSMLEVHAYRTTAGWDVQADRDPELIREPSSTIDAMEWRRQVLLGWMTRGTSFAMCPRKDQYGYPIQAELIPAECVTVRQKAGSRLAEWEWLVDGKVEPLIEDGGMLWVMRGLHCRTGVPVGISPIEMALGAIGLGLAAEDFGTSWFYDGATPSAILTSDAALTKEQAQEYKASWRKALFGKREPVVMGSGMKYEQVQVAANESQFLETLDSNAGIVARFFLFPPEEVGATGGNSMTYSNAESRALALLSRAFQPWITRFEMMLTRQTQAPLKIKVDVSGLIRTDLKTRTDVDVADVQAKIRTKNEVRASRGLPPLEGGDSIAPDPKPEQMAQRFAEVVERFADREPTINVDARTHVEPADVKVDARTTVEPASITFPESTTTIDARTEVHPAAVDARTTIEAGAVDARTEVHPAEIRVDAPVTVTPPAINVDARTEVHPAPPTTKQVTRNSAGDITEIREVAR